MEPMGDRKGMLIDVVARGWFEVARVGSNQGTPEKSLVDRIRLWAELAGESDVLGPVR